MLGGSNVKSTWVLAIIIAISVLSLLNYQKVAADACDNDAEAMNIECMYYMTKNNLKPINPNDRCCKVIRSADIPCCCRHLSQKTFFPPVGTYADMISWNNVLHCFAYCGRPLPVGFKCNRFVVPPGPPPLK